jgi:hypothetical protein
MMTWHFPSHNSLATPLLLDKREAAAAMRAGEYVEPMEKALRELGAGRAAWAWVLIYPAIIFCNKNTPDFHRRLLCVR